MVLITENAVGRFDFSILPGNADSDTLYVKDVDLLEFMPSIPDLRKKGSLPQLSGGVESRMEPHPGPVQQQTLPGQRAGHRAAGHFQGRHCEQLPGEGSVGNTGLYSRKRQRPAVLSMLVRLPG